MQPGEMPAEGNPDYDTDGDSGAAADSDGVDMERVEELLHRHYRRHPGLAATSHHPRGGDRKAQPLLDHSSAGSGAEAT